MPGSPPANPPCRSPDRTAALLPVDARQEAGELVAGGLTKVQACEEIDRLASRFGYGAGVSLLLNDAASELMRVEQLDDSHRAELTGLVRSDAVVNAVIDSRLDALPSLSPHRFGGIVLGVRAGSGPLTGAAFYGGNLLPVGGGSDEWAALAHHLGGQPRTCSSIVGPADAVDGIWSRLTRSWGAHRAVRENQPLLQLDAASSIATRDSRVHIVRSDQLDAYVPAAAAMFTEELGISPYECVGAAEYRARVAVMIRDRRAFALVRGNEVVFKADIGAVSGSTCQVQGVWVRPDLRGQGIGTAALGTVLAHALTLAPTVSLYVNHYNVAARRMYATLGMREVGTFRTVLF